jgi:hypothetical protein
MNVSQAIEPLGENIGFANLNHEQSVVYRLHIINAATDQCSRSAARRSRVGCNALLN